MSNWLTDNQMMESELLQNGIPRHLGWNHISAASDWARLTHGAAHKWHLTKLQEAQAYLDKVVEMPATKRPLNLVLGLPLDKALEQATRQWDTTRQMFRSQKLSLEFAMSLRDLLAAKRDTPDLPSPRSIEDGDYLWLIVTPSSILLASVPPEVEIAWVSEVHSTSRTRCLPLELADQEASRANRPPNTVPVEELCMIPPQHHQWVRSNLAAGAAAVGDLVLPVTESMTAVA